MSKWVVTRKLTGAFEGFKQSLTIDADAVAVPLDAEIDEGGAVARFNGFAIPLEPGGKEPWNKGKTGVFTAEALEKMRRAKIGNKYAAKKRKGPEYEGDSDSEPEGRRWKDNDSR